MAILFESETGNSSENINEIHQLWAKIYERVGLRLGLSTESLRYVNEIHQLWAKIYERVGLRLGLSTESSVSLPPCEVQSARTVRWEKKMP